MQLMRQFYTQEYGLFLVCVLLFLSNTTRGNSSNDPTGFSSEGIDYFPLDYHHNSATPNLILLKDNNRYVYAYAFSLNVLLKIYFCNQIEINEILTVYRNT